MNKFNCILISLFLILSANSFVFSQKRAISNDSPVLTRNVTEFGAVRAFSDGAGVWLEWQMNAEASNLGFNVIRVSGKGQVISNRNLISGAFLRDNLEISAGNEYSFFDADGDLGSVYYIESLAVNGGKDYSKHFQPEYLANVVTVAGRTSADLRAASKKNDYIIERSDPVPNKELQSEMAINSAAPNPEMQRWVASQPGVRIGTSKEGIYRVSREDLANAGFDVNSPPENWQLYKNGNQQSIIVGGSGDFIEFYGNGIDTIESAVQTYFLIKGSTPGKRMNSVFRRRVGGTVLSKSYEQTFYRAERAIYINSIRNGENNNFFNYVINTAGANVNFDLSGVDPDVSQAVMTVVVQGITTTVHDVNVALNGVSLSPMSGSNHVPMVASYTIPTSILIEGTNTLRLTVPVNTSDISLLDSIRVDYSRKYVAKNDSISFYAKQNKQFDVYGFTSRQIRVFDTTNQDEPSIIDGLSRSDDSNGIKVTIPANRSKKMFAVADSAVRSVDSIETNTPSDLSSNAHNAELVIIAHKNWLSESEAWADYRRLDGYSAEVVRVDDIFDEFNFGITSANSVRAFLEHAKNNWQTPPNYVLILGDASYDPRNYGQVANSNFVPTKLFDTAYEETGSDEALADFDNDGLSELAVGRIPAKSAADVTQMFNRVSIFESTAADGFSRGTLFASDLPNGYDFAGMSQRLANELPPGTTSVMVNRGDVNARATLLNQLNTGKYLVNYSGHGAPSLWAATSFYSSSDVPTMANGTNYTLFTMLTCLNGYFLSPNYDSLAELTLKSPNGGGAAVWASSGKTTPDVQEILARRFFQKISLGSISRMGDLVKDAKQNVIGGRDVRLSWTLLGDPTMKVH